jgi:hypothetical protein
MTTTKYGKYILRPPERIEPQPGTAAAIPVILEGLKDWGGIQHRMRWAFITSPNLMVAEPHSHDCDEFLGFYGCDPAHEHDFGAEIELSLGREREKQVICAPSVICLPQGLIHGPLDFKKITRPILFVHIYVGPEYRRIAVA